MLFGYEPRRYGDPRAASREHLIPRSLGGSNNKTNVVIACRRCNNGRRSEMDWVPFRVHGGDPNVMAPHQRTLLHRAEPVRAGGGSG